MVWKESRTPDTSSNTTIPKESSTAFQVVHQSITFCLKKIRIIVCVMIQHDKARPMSPTTASVMLSYRCRTIKVQRKTCPLNKVFKFNNTSYESVEKQVTNKHN